MNRKKLFDLAEHLEAAMDDIRLGQELLMVAESGTNEDVQVLCKFLEQFK